MSIQKSTSEINTFYLLKFNSWAEWSQNSGKHLSVKRGRKGINREGRGMIKSSSSTNIYRMRNRNQMILRLFAEEALDGKNRWKWLSLHWKLLSVTFKHQLQNNSYTKVKLLLCTNCSLSLDVYFERANSTEVHQSAVTFDWMTWNCFMSTSWMLVTCMRTVWLHETCSFLTTHFILRLTIKDKVRRFG